MWSTRPLTESRRAFVACLVLFTGAGLLVRAAGAILRQTIERPDEIYQNIEPAYRLWTGWGVVTWEWRDGIRSWLMPGFIALLMRLSTLFHLPERAALPLVWLVFSAIATLIVIGGVALGWRRAGLAGAVICGVLTAFWPDLVYYGPKTLTEVQGGNMLAFAAILACFGPPTERYGRLRALVIGLLLGLSFDLRLQLAPGILIVALWTGRLDLRRAWLPMIVGGLITVGLLGIVDTLTWGSPFQSIWKNLFVNLVQDKASFYGESPLLAYFGELTARNGLLALLALTCFVYGAVEAPLLVLVAVVVVASHSLISHKEISFIYAALPCAVIVCGLGIARFLRRLPDIVRRPIPPAQALVIAACYCLLAMSLTNMSEKPFVSTRIAGLLQSLWGYAQSEPDLCGLGLYGREDFLWGETLGYSGLRRKVPISLVRSQGVLAPSQRAFNYAIATRDDMVDLTGYTRLRCSGNYCLLHRPGLCEPVPSQEISADLLRAGE